jgi:signal transduction histidine kinase
LRNPEKIKSSLLPELHIALMHTPKTQQEKQQDTGIFQVLIVDDRPENLLTLESIIEKEGRRIIKATGGNEALRLAIRESIGLVMLDIQMPEIDGIEVARLLRSNNATRHIPIIFVSAINNSEKLCMEEFAEGTVDCLHKPLAMEETRNKVAMHEQLYQLRLECNRLKEIADRDAMQFEQFVYIVSHDLKAPLRAIDNLTNWISEDLGNKADGNINENLQLMKSRVGRMQALLEGILEFARSGRYSEPSAKIDIRHLAHAVFESLVPPQGFTLETSNLEEVLLEPPRMYTILYHILKNSVIHHPDPGNGIVNISCEKDEGQLIFTVSDNGTGIKPQYSKKIFELFTTLKSRDEMETPGIGLPVVKKVLMEIGGTIWLDTTYTKGASFKFTIPQ